MIALCFTSLTAIILLTACRPNILRYGNRATCAGFLHGTRDLSALIPNSVAGINLQWSRGNDSFVLNDNNGDLHVINKLGVVAVDQVNRNSLNRSAPLSVAEEFDLLAVSVWPGSMALTYVYSFGKAVAVDPTAIIKDFLSPHWHPYEPLLAGVVYPDDDAYEHGSNIVGVYDLQGSAPTLTASYELAYSDIADVIGWSATGQVIAVLQYEENGLTPHYLFPDDDGRVQGSLFSTANHSCVLDGQWSPAGDVLAFTGVNETMEGWDIFLETVAAPGSGHDGSLLNLTNSPQEDERGATWSPDGDYIANTKAYKDESGRLQQELFLTVVEAAARSSRQLTATPDEFESNPIWLSESEIGYLSWKPLEQSWTLNILTMRGETTTSRQVMEIPPSWYWNPFADDDS